MAAGGLTRFERGCIAVVVAAFALRLTFILQPGVIWDSAWYLLLARSFGETGTFLLPWSDPAAPEYSGYWPPLFPIFLSPVVKLLGPSYESLVAGAILAGALLTAGVFFTTRDLMGRPRAFAAMAIVAATPAFYLSESKGMSESLLALMVVLTVWAFVRSLDRPIFLPLAGAFAFLAYMGKATLGLPLVGAGIVGLGAWRVYTRGWRRVVRSPMDMGLAAAGLIGALILASTRSERIGGLGLGIIAPLSEAFGGAECSRFLPIDSIGPLCWFLAYPMKVVFVSVFLLVVTLPLSLRLPDLLRAPRSERTDALWLATILPLLAGAVFTMSFFFTERRPFVDFDNIRYLTPAIVPFIWLLLPHTPLDEPEADGPAPKGDLRRRHETWYWSGVGAMIIVLLFSPLAGQATLARFLMLMALGLIPIGLSMAARATRYDIAERRAVGGIERRYVPSTTRSKDRGVMLAAAAVLILGGWYYSSWYAAVAVGLVVALATPSPTRRVVAMSLILLASAAAGYGTKLPMEAASDELEKFPAGTLVGLSEVAVYTAAATPRNVDVRLIDPDAPIPPDVDALLVQQPYQDRSFDGFTRVAAWDYDYTFSPTLAARLWIEENVLGLPFGVEGVPGLVLHVRNATAE